MKPAVFPAYWLRTSNILVFLTVVSLPAFGQDTFYDTGVSISTFDYGAK